MRLNLFSEGDLDEKARRYGVTNLKVKSTKTNINLHNTKKKSIIQNPAMNISYTF